MLRDKVALITGASRGLGRALALAYAKEGAKVVITARSKEGLQPVADEVEGLDAEILAVPADVARRADVEDLVAAAIERFGKVDVLVNNAGVLGPRVEILAYPDHEWQRVLDTNLTAPFLLSRVLVPHMPRGGSIINISSGVSVAGRAKWGAYSVSKFGIEGLTQIMAAELGERGVRVNSVDPGAMRTEMRAAAYPEEDPMTLITPEENVAVFLYLASDDSREVTGQRLKAQEFKSN